MPTASTVDSVKTAEIVRALHPLQNRSATTANIASFVLHAAFAIPSALKARGVPPSRMRSEASAPDFKTYFQELTMV